MKAVIERGRICVDASDLIDSLDDDGRISIIDILACHDQIIELVAAQIVTGRTESGSRGSTTYSPLPSTPLDKAKRYLAESASAIAKDQWQRLETMASNAMEKARDETGKRIDAEHLVYELKAELRGYRGRAA